MPLSVPTCSLGCPISSLCSVSSFSSLLPKKFFIIAVLVKQQLIFIEPIPPGPLKDQNDYQQDPDRDQQGSFSHSTTYMGRMVRQVCPIMPSTILNALIRKF